MIQIKLFKIVSRRIRKLWKRLRRQVEMKISNLFKINVGKLKILMLLVSMALSVCWLTIVVVVCACPGLHRGPVREASTTPTTTSATTTTAPCWRRRPRWQRNKPRSLSLRYHSVTASPHHASQPHFPLNLHPAQSTNTIFCYFQWCVILDSLIRATQRVPAQTLTGHFFFIPSERSKD